MSRYSSGSHRRHKDEPSSSDRRPYGFVYPDLNNADNYGYEQDDDDNYDRNGSYEDDEYDRPSKNNSYKDDRDYRRRGRYEDDDDDRYYSRRRGGYDDDDDDDYYDERQPQSGDGFFTSIFWIIYTLFTSPLTILARAGAWLLSTIFMFTPLYPFYLLFKKGTNVFGWIGGFMGFCKDLLAIAYNCAADVSNNRGYMTHELPGDIRQAFSKLLGYQSHQEVDDGDYDDRVRGKGWKKRAFDAGMYGATAGHYPKNLSGHGVSPQRRSGSHGPSGNKSSIFSMLLSLGGMLYYILTGQFLYNNSNENNDRQGSYRSPGQRRRYEEQQKKSYMRGIIGFGVLVLALWWLWSSGILGRGFEVLVKKVLSTFASLTYWLIKKSFYLLFWIPSLFFRSNDQGGYNTPTATDTGYAQYPGVTDIPEYLTNITSGGWKFITDNLLNGLNATNLYELKNADPSQIGNILYRQFTRSLRWTVSQLISGCFHANVCH